MSRSAESVSGLHYSQNQKYEDILDVIMRVKSVELTPRNNPQDIKIINIWLFLTFKW